jgi:hypothetical protein
MENFGISSSDIRDDIPSKNNLLLADALLFAVYGWSPKKVSRMSLSSLKKWVRLAKIKMTWKDAYKFDSLLEAKPKRVSLWKKIILKIKS